MAGSFEHRAGYAGERPATRTAELPAYKPGQELETARENASHLTLMSPAPTCGAQLAAGAVVDPEHAAEVDPPSRDSELGASHTLAHISSANSQAAADIKIETIETRLCGRGGDRKP